MCLEKQNIKTTGNAVTETGTKPSCAFTTSDPLIPKLRHQLQHLTLSANNRTENH